MAEVVLPTLVEEKKRSLREQPSYLKEVAVALTRRQELLKLKERLSSTKLLLDADPSTKPWMLVRSISSGSIKDEDIPAPSLITRERMERELSETSDDTTDMKKEEEEK